MEREGDSEIPRPAQAAVLALFDVDGTLTPARKEADPDMLMFLQELRKVVKVGILGGSDLVKISEQLGPTTTSDYDYVFAENGLVAYKDGKPLACQNLKLHMGEDQLKELINFILHYLADLDMPFKRGTFVEFRTGIINVSPVGRNCSREERQAFIEYDKVHRVRDKMVIVLKEKFGHLNLSFPIGGEISFDVFPTGWDKTYCLQFLDKHFSDIHFFGDRTYEGGNDYEIYSSPRTIGHAVTCPEDTKKLCTDLFLSKTSS